MRQGIHTIGLAGQGKALKSDKMGFCSQVPPRGVVTRFMRDKPETTCAKTPVFSVLCAYVAVNGVNSNKWMRKRVDAKKRD